jgi:hypothetical protein
MRSAFQIIRGTWRFALLAVALVIVAVHFWPTQSRVDPTRSGVLYVPPPELPWTWSGNESPTTAPTTSGIDPRPPRDMDAIWAREVQNHAALIGRLQNLMSMLTDNSQPLRHTEWFKSRAHPADALLWLSDHLRIEVLPGTSLIQLTITGDCMPDDAKTVITAVGDAYVRSCAEEMLASRMAETRGDFEQLTLALNLTRGHLVEALRKEQIIRDTVPADRGPNYRSQLDAARVEVARLRQSLAAMEEQKNRRQIYVAGTRDLPHWRVLPEPMLAH